MHDIESGPLPQRMRSAVSLAWSLFARKVGSGLIPVNKEASMQLQYAYLLQQVLPLITFRADEKLTLELETSTKVASSFREIDVLVRGESDEGAHRIAIEMKCYRNLSASGKRRGATDIFLKDVYDDLAILERYIEVGHAEEGVALVVTDLERMVNPKTPRPAAKWLNYDISHGTAFGPVALDVPIGGKPVNIELKRSYLLEWVRYGGFWFLEVEGRAVEGEAATFDPVSVVRLRESIEG